MQCVWLVYYELARHGVAIVTLRDAAARVDRTMRARTCTVTSERSWTRANEGSGRNEKERDRSRVEEMNR
jgi:hypothetical protein